MKPHMNLIETTLAPAGHWMRGKAVWVGMVLSMLAMTNLKAQISIGQTDTLRLMHYNLCNYGNNVFSCPRVNRVGMKDSSLRTILATVQPDMLGCNEVNSNPIYSDRILQLVLNAGANNDWARAATTNSAASDLVNAFFYRTSKVGLKAQYAILSPVRDINHYRMYVQPQSGQTDTIFFNVLQAHLKAGSTAADTADRARMVRVLNTYLAAQDTSEGFIFQGDFNFYRATEPANRLLVNRAAGGFFIDPLNRQGTWTGNASFKDVHTQSPHGGTADGCHANGGLDDRFDFQLCTQGLFTGNKPMTYLASAFRVIGNDGQHFNQSVTAGTNATVTPVVAAALMHSDHLPILGKLLVQFPTAVQPRAQATVKAWLSATQLRVSGLRGEAEASFYSMTGARLGSTTVSAQGLADLPPTAAGTLLVILQPRDGAQAPSVFRLTTVR